MNMWNTKLAIRAAIRRFGYEIKKAPREEPKPTGLYQPFYSPWLRDDSPSLENTCLSRDRIYVLDRLVRQSLTVPGDLMECGVYRGGSARFIRTILDGANSRKKLYLFDTFEGMPETDPNKDWHLKGDFRDTSLEEVSKFVGGNGQCDFRKGFIPDTFAGLENLTISFAHIDVDIYRSIIDSLKFVWPRLSTGGIILFDDYGVVTCPGAREAVDEFFADKTAVPFCLQTGQAIVFKSVAHQ